MRSILGTIPPDAQFMYQKQGLYNVSQTGVPIADGSRLLPFVSMPFLSIDGTINGYLYDICDNYIGSIGELNTITKNNTITVHWPQGKDSGLTIPMGYYYVRCIAEVPPGNATAIFNAYKDRVNYEGTKYPLEAEQCVLDVLADLAGGELSLPLFKTETFYMDSVATQPLLGGSFNKSFEISYDI